MLATALCGSLPCPSEALSVGEALPPPSAQLIDGGTADIAAWLRDDFVVWYLFDERAQGSAEALRWLALPARTRPGLRVVGAPVGGRAPSGLTSDAAAVPLVADGDLWRPQLGPGTKPPVLVFTRPPGRVIALRKDTRAAAPAVAAFMFSVHMNRDDWPAALDTLKRAGEPLLDPTLRAARGFAALGAGDGGTAGYEADGLARTGPNQKSRAAGWALQAEIARRDGKFDAAAKAAEAGQALSGGHVVRAALALGRGDFSAARRAAAAARDADTMPWAAGTGPLMVAHVGIIQARYAAAREAAADATVGSPASWMAWQTLGLLEARAGNENGVTLLRAAALLAPPGVAADRLATAVAGAWTDEIPSAAPDMFVVLEQGSVAHARWPGAGDTASLLLADALRWEGAGRAEAYALSPRARATGHPLGDPMSVDDALAAAKDAGVPTVLILRMQLGDRGVVLNTRALRVRSRNLRSVHSVVWTADLTLAEACQALAHRIKDGARRID